MQSEVWIQKQHAQAEKGLHQAAESGELGFVHVLAALDLLK